MVIIRSTGIEIAAPSDQATASDMNRSRIFRAVNTGTGPALITLSDSENNVVGTLTLVSGGSQMFFKKNTEKVHASSVDVLLSPQAMPQG